MTTTKSISSTSTATNAKNTLLLANGAIGGR
jgi:hypothetical protein